MVAETRRGNGRRLRASATFRIQGSNDLSGEKTKGLQPRKPFSMSRRPRRSALDQIDVSLPLLR